MVGPAGHIGGRSGAVTSAADSLKIRLFGRGAHGSMPQASIDPVVMAAAIVMLRVIRDDDARTLVDGARQAA